MTSPDFLPSLAAGAHDADDGEACVMEYVSLLAGEEWSDRPECTHPLLAHEARMLNDDLADRDRHLLVPLIGRLFGTTDDSPTLTARLRLRQVTAVLRLLDPTARTRVAAVVDRAEQEARRPPQDGDAGTQPPVDQAREIARSFPASETASDDPAHEAHHLQLARMAFVGLAGDIGAAEAWAFAAQVVAHRVAASGECRADCGDSMSHARMRVHELAELIDEYDASTGREVRRLTTDEVRELSVLVG